MTIEQIISANQSRGYHFFDRDTLRFFRSRVDRLVWSGPTGHYFVTSEQHVHEGLGIKQPRRYTVRRADDEGRIHTESFQEFETLRAARSAAKRRAEQTEHL